jgi:hypothetical protein
MTIDNFVVNNLMQHKSYHVFTHRDLDGAVSLLTFIWSRPDAQISYDDITNLEIKKIKMFINKTINPNNIVLLDLALREEFLPELDKEYITIIDHHERSASLIEKFKNAKILHKNFSSNCLLIRKLTQSDEISLTDSQKKLILFADDYDCFELKYKESYDLNIIFWTQFKNNFESFIRYYFDGFKPFTKEQLNIINSNKQEAQKIANALTCYTTHLNINNKNISCFAVTNDKMNFLSMDYLINKHNPDLFMFINTKTEKITFRLNKKITDFDLKQFVEKYCEGSSNKHSGTGKITPMFLELTKNFKTI